jgi:hypothetical protein
MHRYSLPLLRRGLDYCSIRYCTAHIECYTVVNYMENVHQPQKKIEVEIRNRFWNQLQTGNSPGVFEFYIIIQAVRVHVLSGVAFQLFESRILLALQEARNEQ